jgi:hypothetical protein
MEPRGRPDDIQPVPHRPGHPRPSVSFGIAIQDDGTAADRFKVKATGTATTRYTVKYYRGATDITTKVVAGTYLTPSLAVGASYLITAKVAVKSTATLARRSRAW